MEFVRYLDVFVILFFTLIWVSNIVFLKFKKKKSLLYLTLFSIFYLYIFKVLDYTLFQFQSLVVLKYFMPDLILRGQSAGESLNLIPLFTLRVQDLKTSLLNILLFIPLGFGLPFVARLRMEKIVILGLFFSIVIESLQLMTGIIAKITFRVTDINDVIFNTLGVVMGYLIFRGFVYIYNRVARSKTIFSKSFARFIQKRM